MAQRRFRTAARFVLTLAWAAAPMPGLAQDCTAESGVSVPVVVELYTSEGCNSCPSADRWLSSLKPRPDVLTAAFHVDYWDRLGWKDRFASALYTERQAQQQASSGARFSYTPQVLVNGRDWRRWPDLPSASARSTLQLGLRRQGEQVEMTAQPVGAAPVRLALWWAALEDGHVSAVQSGENAGATLRHDSVVRHYGQLTPWSGASVQRFNVPTRGEGGRPLRVLAVAIDAATRAPVQAVQLSCPP
jgi:hypothetical protein